MFTDRWVGASASCNLFVIAKIDPENNPENWEFLQLCGSHWMVQAQEKGEEVEQEARKGAGAGPGCHDGTGRSSSPPLTTWAPLLEHCTTHRTQCM